MSRDAAVIERVQRHAVPITLETAGRRLLDAIDRRVSLVLVGEATHGTHEFYRIRAELTRLLSEERGFTGVAAEADWPDAYRANRWVRWLGDDTTAEEALDDFTRFPRWMWRNREVDRSRVAAGRGVLVVLPVRGRTWRYSASHARPRTAFAWRPGPASPRCSTVAATSAASAASRPPPDLDDLA